MHVENLLSFVRSSKSGGGDVSTLLCLSVNEVRTNSKNYNECHVNLYSQSYLRNFASASRY